MTIVIAFHGSGKSGRIGIRLFAKRAEGNHSRLELRWGVALRSRLMFMVNWIAELIAYSY